MDLIKKNSLDELCPHPIVLAPMVGLTHYAVRAAIAEFLPAGARALWPTEMLNSRRLHMQKENQNPELTFKDKANGLCPQILGNEEQYIRSSIKKLTEWGAVAIDINMGCPVNRALKHNYGVALMGDPKYAAEVTSMAVRNSALPVSVKLRAGLGGTDEGFLFDFVQGIFEAGAAWVTLHPRTAEQKRKGSADWNLIRKLKQKLNRPIIGNGDVQCTEDIQVMKEETGCDRVMIGRALIAKPWLVWGDDVDPDPTVQGELYGKYLLRVLDFVEAEYEEGAGMRRMRFLVVQSKPWVEFGETLYGKLFKAKNYAETRAELLKFFSQSQRMVKRTTLRA